LSFTHIETEIKENLKNNRDWYVRKLKNKKVIDEEAADMFIYG